MNVRVIGSGTAVLMLAASVSLRAHHARTAEYDTTAPVTLVGRITEVEWTNPHSFIEIDCKTPDGKIESWRVEVGPPFMLAKAGITRDLLAVGAIVTVDGVRAKNGSTRAWGVEMTFSNGTIKMVTDEPDGTGRLRDPASKERGAEIPLTLHPIDVRPPSRFEQLVSSVPFLPYLVVAAPVIVLLAGLLVWRGRQRSNVRSTSQ
jgi:hypothetical protein